MNHPSREVLITIREKQRGERDTRLHGRWLLLARIIWIAVVVLLLASFFASILGLNAMLQSGCTTAACRSILAPYTIKYIEAGGLSVSFFLLYNYALFVILLLVYLIIGVVLFWFRSRDGMALFTSFALVTFPMAFNGSLVVGTVPLLSLPVQIVTFVSYVAFGTLLYLFPNGRFVPRWSRWLVVALVGYWGINTFFPNSPVAHFWLIGLLFPFLQLSGVGAQVYRYLRVSNQVERQQTKWVVFGLSISIIGGLSVIGFYYFNWFSIFHPNIRSDLVAGVLLYMFELLVPLSMAIAILRYRLWDIDVIIRRTLVYGSLTALLATLYFGLIFALQFLFQGIFHQSNAVAIVISTLIIAALFQPLHHRIQAIIDRHFYRHKYDAVKTVEAFSTTLRSEVDLSQLREQLLAVVEETMQPAHVSLWLRPPTHEQVPWRATPSPPTEREAREGR